jgi:hypothetical protein
MLCLLICAPLRIRRSHLGLHILRGEAAMEQCSVVDEAGVSGRGEALLLGCRGGGNGQPTPWPPHSERVLKESFIL